MYCNTLVFVKVVVECFENCFLYFADSFGVAFLNFIALEKGLEIVFFLGRPWNPVRPRKYRHWHGYGKHASLDPHLVNRRVGGESNQEIVSCRAVRACVLTFVRAVWLPSGFRSQRRQPVFSLFLFSVPSIIFSIFAFLSFPFFPSVSDV